jgi:hypothetical protein
METFPIRVQTVRRPPDPGTPAGDDALGGFLVDALLRDLARGAGAPAALVGRESGMDVVPLTRELVSRIRVELLLAGLTRSATHDGPARLVGLLGRFRHVQHGPVALVFLEWPDCRWWSWSSRLGDDRRPLPAGERYTRAVSGDPMPDGLGRWWSLGRRTGARVRFGPPVMPGPADDTVH